MGAVIFLERINELLFFPFTLIQYYQYLLQNYQLTTLCITAVLCYFLFVNTRYKRKLYRVLKAGFLWVTMYPSVRYIRGIKKGSVLRIKKIPECSRVRWLSGMTAENAVVLVEEYTGPTIIRYKILQQDNGSGEIGQYNESDITYLIGIRLLSKTEAAAALL